MLLLPIYIDLRELEGVINKTLDIIHNKDKSSSILSNSSINVKRHY